MTSSSFANSPGWIWMPPTRIHSFAPFTVVPTTMVPSSSTTAAAPSVYL